MAEAAAGDGEKTASSGMSGSLLVAGGLGVAALHAVAVPFLLPALRRHCLPYVAANAAQLELPDRAARVAEQPSSSVLVCSQWHPRHQECRFG